MVNHGICFEEVPEGSKKKHEALVATELLCGYDLRFKKTDAEGVISDEAQGEDLEKHGKT